MSECDDLKKCREVVSDRLTKIESDISDINKKLDGMAEILTINKNVKGFVATAGVLGKVLVWITLTGGAITAIWKYLTHMGQS